MLVSAGGFAYRNCMRSRLWFKQVIPASFYGRAVLILIIPILVIQIVLSVVFIQRHYERVTTQLTTNTSKSLRILLDRLDAARQPEPALRALQDVFAQLDIDLTLPATLPGSVAPREPLDLAGAEILRSLQDTLPEFLAADLSRERGTVQVWLETRHGVLHLAVPRRLLTTPNPHQLLVIVFLASVVMTLIAFQFLRLQVRPIRRLGAAAEAYGRGERVALRASGAREIQAAARAFIDMRNRLERQRNRQQMMLSGVSHDMRTPLTRMRLILSMMDEGDDRTALETEIGDVEQRLEQFLDYTRGPHTEEAPQSLAPEPVIAKLVARYQAAGHAVAFHPDARPSPRLSLRPGALSRALDNLLSNALRHGSRVEVSTDLRDEALVIKVEDDGPGIPPDARERAVEAFVRLDEARNSDSGGVGLGLAIVSDVARAHGGHLELDKSARLGGLAARLVLPLKPPAQSR